MVAAADEPAPQLTAAGNAEVSVSLTGASGMWADFNDANRSAMMKSELLSWPVTLAILVLAFGSLAAAGLPLLLTILGLMSAAGLLAVLANGFDISIWAMNFALMFALAPGSRLRALRRPPLRGAYFGSRLPRAGGRSGDHGHRGKGGPLLRPDGAHLARPSCSCPARRSARWRSGSCSASSSCWPRP